MAYTRAHARTHSLCHGPWRTPWPTAYGMVHGLCYGMGSMSSHMVYVMVCDIFAMTARRQPDHGRDGAWQANGATGHGISDGVAVL